MKHAGQWILKNGQWFNNSDVITSANRSFLYGDGIFETMRTIGTEILFYDAHISRLHSSMERLYLPVIKDLTKERLIQNCIKLIHKNKFYNGGRLRLTVFRESSGRYTPVADRTGYLLEGESLITEPVYPFQSKGKLLTLFSTIKKYRSPLSPIKTTSSQFYVLAGLFARKNGFDDCLILNDKDEIIETVSANILVIKDQNIIAPGPESGALDGTMRKNAISIAGKMGFNIDERGCKEQEILSADEIVLTNAIQGITHAKGYCDRRYYSRTGKQLSVKLNQKVV